MSWDFIFRYTENLHLSLSDWDLSYQQIWKSWLVKTPVNERARLGGIIWSGAYLWHIRCLILKSHRYLGLEFVLKLLDIEKLHKSPAGLELGEKIRVLTEVSISKIMQNICDWVPPHPELRTFWLNCSPEFFPSKLGSICPPFKVHGFCCSLRPVQSQIEGN